MAAKKILIGLSGGVDSAVAAALLKTQGFEVVALHISMWPEKGSSLNCAGSCFAKDRLKYAKQVAEELDLQLYQVDAHEMFVSEILDASAHAYIEGRVPNPCVTCHGKIKVAHLLRKADELKIELVATGHYAKIVKNPDGTEVNLYCGTDETADQSYYLFELKQKELARLIVPLGDLLKTNVKKMANTFRLPAIAGSTSRETCLVDDNEGKTLAELITPERYKNPGPIVNQEGYLIARHGGFMNYKLGSNEGPQMAKVAEQGMVVLGFDYKANSLVVGPKESLPRTGVLAMSCNWIGMQDFSRGISARARLLPDMVPVKCHISLLNNNSIWVEFDSPQSPVQAGQAIVFYQEEFVIGGGWVEGVLPPVLSKSRTK